MEDQFLTLLQNSVAMPGFLKIITNEVSSELRVDPENPRSPVRPDVLEDFPDVMKHHSTMVLHDVVAIEAHPAKEGLYRAFSAEGDMCEGRPQALWDRLTEHHK